MLYKIALVGFGAANMLFLAYIASSAPSLLEDTVIIDPTLSGGALQHSWPQVRSNTVWKQFIDALKRFSSTAQYAEQIASANRDDEPTPLHVLARHLREAVQPYMRKTTLIKDTVYQIEESDKIFKILTKTHTIQAEKVIFSPGSTPKVFNYPIPTIPLSAALDVRQVGNYVSSGERVVLFGTAHSGCLVLKNLVDSGARVVVVYATAKPFLFARDGEYDGIKQDAADIADSVLAGNTQVELVHYSKQEEVISSLLRASWVCYTVGFELDDAAKKIFISNEKYNPQTARLREGSEIYGFGIAFPSYTTIGEKVFWDVSIPSFTEHILKTNILSTVSSE
jgi:hypothetical protein